MNVTEQFRLRDVGGDHPAMQFTMPLVSNHEGDVRCIGTAFLIAPGLAITAEHVASSWLNYQERRDGYKRDDSTFSVSALQLVDGQIYQWNVDAIYASRSADIAFLRFHRPTWFGSEPGQVIPPCAQLNFTPPSKAMNFVYLGSPVVALRITYCMYHRQSAVPRYDSLT